MDGRWWSGRAGVVAAVVVLLAACAAGEGGDGAEPSWASAVDTVGDTVVVRTLSGSIWGAAARLEPEVVIGALDGPLEYILGRPRSLAVAPDGTVYLLDTQVPVVRAYAPDGTHLRDVGREGGGPGEYAGPDAIAVLSDGRLLVRDPSNNRITVYSAGGEYLEEWRHGGGFNTNRRFYVDREDHSYATTLLEFGVGPWDWEFGLVRRDAHGTVIDTLPAPVWAFEPAQLTASRERSRSVRRVPFTAQSWWTFSPLGYMVGGASVDYRVELFRPGGPTLRVERAWTPVAVRADEAEAERRRITESLQRQYGSWRWNGPPIPETKPPFTGVFTSDEGRVWVQRSTEGVEVMSAADARAEEEATGRAPERFVEPPAFDVFSPEGAYLGEVLPPPDFRTEPDPIIRGDTVWAVTRDDLDVPRVVRFRIVRGDEAS